LSYPPYDFIFYYLKQLSSAITHSGEIVCDLSAVNDVEDYNEREVVIAGHCFLCEKSTW